MDELANIHDLYIRSFGSRSASDGLTDNLPELVAAMDQFHFDEVVVETVGVGQAEYAIRPHVDTLVLVLLPDSGDIVQAMKAGIIELADILVVNKSDLAGARKMAADIKRIAVFNRSAHANWKPPVLLTASEDEQSIEALSQAITNHRAYLESSGHRDTLLKERAGYRLKRLMERDISSILQTMDGADLSAPLITQYRYVLTRLDALR